MYTKLESLRGIAACLVVLFHSPFNFGEESIVFVKNSYLFVDFFFILSGFVMSYAYGDKITDKTNNMSFGTYIALRLGRIYPLHIFMLFVWLPYILLKHVVYTSGYGGNPQFEENNLFTFFTNILLLHSMGIHDSLSWNYPSWSISTEFFAYVAFYIITVLVDRGKFLLFPLVVILICYAIFLSIERKNFDNTYDYGFVRCLGAFYLGVFIFRLKLRFNFELSNTYALNVLEISVVALSAMAITQLAGNTSFFILSIISFASIILIYSNSQRGILGSILDKAALRKIGVWSYSIYMVHAIVVAGTSNVFEYILKFNLDSALGVLSIIINCFILFTTIFISKFTYDYIENKSRSYVKERVRKFNA